MGAITNKIKTYSTLYSCTEVDGEVPENPVLQAMRISENGIAGSAEEITSDIMLPDTRIESTPEVGTESNTGDVGTEWNIDEQDEWFAGAFCSEWETINANKKVLHLGENQKSFTLLGKFPQTPATWQHYKKEFINSLSMDFQTDQFVKLIWNFMGSNNPKQVTADPLASFNPTYNEALKTKSFITKSGMWLKVGDDVASLEACRQSPSMNISISNNLERTPALGEDESIENSLGHFTVEGNVDVYNVDQKGIDLYNDAVEGKDKVLQVAVSRQVGTVLTRYILTLNVHFSAPSKSKNGNKFQFSIPFKVNDDKDLSLEKVVIDTTEPVVDAETPEFDTTWEATASDETSVTLDGSASVTDGGTVSYQWFKDNVEIDDFDEATYAATESGTYKVVATNTNESATGETTATAEQTCVVTIG